MNRNMEIYTQEMEAVVGGQPRKNSMNGIKRRSHSTNSYAELEDNEKPHKKYCRSEQKKYSMSDQY